MELAKGISEIIIGLIIAYTIYEFFRRTNKIIYNQEKILSLLNEIKKDR